MLEYIAKKDRNNPEKYAAILRGPEDGEVSIKCQVYTGIGYRTVYTAFVPNEKFTAKRCKELAEKAMSATEDEIVRIEIDRSDENMVVYWVAKNCLRVYQGSDSVRECVYENNNGTICNDIVALMDSGCGNPYVF